MIGKVFKNFQAFVEGRGYAGKVDELTPPKLGLKTEEVRAGGMDAPEDVDMGMEKLTTDFTMMGYEKEVIARFGLAPGTQTQIVFRGAIQDETGTVEACVINATGKVTSIERGAWKAGEKSTVKVSMTLGYYKETIGGLVVTEIDVENMKRIINGVDQIAAIRAAIGM